MDELRLKEKLKKYWGYSNFREPQLNVIQRLLSGSDVLVLLSTGSGKSICYQLPSLFLPKPVLVISPLIALMEDQKTNLEKIGLNAVIFHAGMSQQEMRLSEEKVENNEVQLVYLAPERVQSKTFANRWKNHSFSAIAIDEAHCISQWGYDFRPSYLKLWKLRSLFPGLPIIALTGSATKRVKADIVKYLHLKSPDIFEMEIKRHNLEIECICIEDHLRALKSILLKTNPSYSGIIYVRNRRYCEELYNELKGIVSCHFYHAGLSHKDRSARQKEWQNDQVKLIIATNAFGMGIDKNDVRYVIHLGIPPSLEEYTQEIGRAGRDGNVSRCLMFYRQKEVKKLKVNGFPDFQYLRDLFEFLNDNIQEKTDPEFQHQLESEKLAADYNLELSAWNKSLQQLSRVGLIDIMQYISGGEMKSKLVFHKRDVDWKVVKLKYQSQQTIEKEKLAAIHLFLKSRKCRHSIINEYFGYSKSNPCQHCDRCKAQIDQEDIIGLEHEILRLVAYESQSLDDILWNWHSGIHKRILKLLRKMEAEGKLTFSENMQMVGRSKQSV